MAFKNPPSERFIVAAIFAAGVALRFMAIDRLAVEHFDEGVYASDLWYQQATGEPWPSRQLYAPPLLGWMMQMFDWIPGLHQYAPFLPGILTGSLTILVIWQIARRWFGAAAGLFAAAIVACSDFHILCSQMAMTDVPVLLFICLSVMWGVQGVFRNCFRLMLAAGLMCGVAWWIKYTGWLPVAIVGSGSLLWWIWVGRRQLSLIRLSALLATMVVTAACLWAPWWWMLQPVGGYSAVAANHRGYLGDLSSWSPRLALQLTFQFILDGITGAASAGIGLLAAGGYRWMKARQDLPAPAGMPSGPATFPPRRLLVRFVVAAIGLSIISLTVWTPLLLSCLAFAGLSGVFLWPVLQRAFLRQKADDLSPAVPSAIPFCRGDLECAPQIDPQLGFCVTVAWLAGMLVATPFYHPYPRLFMPLLAAIWISASAGVGWWVESNLSVARRPDLNMPRSGLQRLATQLVAALLIFATASSALMNHGVFTSLILADRTTLRQAAFEIATACAADATGQRSEEGIRQARMVVYVFGEPALLYHLNDLGVTARPVSHLNLGHSSPSPGATPAFLVIGPHAKRTPNFWNEWFLYQFQFQSLDNVAFRPSQLVLLDLFSPDWLRMHPEAAEQNLEVYRIR